MTSKQSDISAYQSAPESVGGGVSLPRGVSELKQCIASGLHDLSSAESFISLLKQWLMGDKTDDLIELMETGMTLEAACKCMIDDFQDIQEDCRKLVINAENQQVRAALVEAMDAAAAAMTKIALAKAKIYRNHLRMLLNGRLGYLSDKAKKNIVGVLGS